MPAKDLYHDCVRQALIKEGWTITHDPLSLRWNRADVHIDLGAEKLLAAEKQGQTIAVEIKSFTAKSNVSELERAIGQYELYERVLRKRDPKRVLFLAVPADIYDSVFEESIGKLFLEDEDSIRLIVFDPVTEVLTKWIN